MTITRATGAFGSNSTPELREGGGRPYMLLVYIALHVAVLEAISTGVSLVEWLLVIAILHCEGWHNNHHHYPASATYGFRWWEVDGTYTLLRLLALAAAEGTISKVDLNKKPSRSRKGQGQRVQVQRQGESHRRRREGEGWQGAGQRRHLRRLREGAESRREADVRVKGRRAVRGQDHRDGGRARVRRTTDTNRIRR